MACGVIAAIDTPDPAQARRWAAAIAPTGALLKLGLEFYLANGAAGVRSLTAAPIFLDLKLHDIPNTVAGAVRAVLPLAPRMLSLHAMGGAAMLEAARRALAGISQPPLLLAVTVLTSLNAAALATAGVAEAPALHALRLGRLALAAGADGLICSPHEIAVLRDALGSAPVLVVPGIRPVGAPADDQARTMTPAAAAQAGADWIVIGRPITRATDPAAAAAAIVAELS